MGLWLLNLLACQAIDEVEQVQSSLREGLNYSVRRGCVQRLSLQLLRCIYTPFKHLFTCESLTSLSISFTFFLSSLHHSIAAHFSDHQVSLRFILRNDLDLRNNELYNVIYGWYSSLNVLPSLQIDSRNMLLYVVICVLVIFLMNNIAAWITVSHNKLARHLLRTLTNPISLVLATECSSCSP